MSVSLKDLKDEQVSLLQRYRKGDVSSEEKQELYEFLNSLRDIPGFTLKSLLTEFAYNDFDYKRLNTEWYRYRRKQEKEETIAHVEEPGTRTKDKATMITKGATDRLFEQVKEIGTLLVAQYTKNAADRGEKLKDYVMKAIQLREEHGDQIENLIQQNDMLKALCSIFVEAAKPQFKQMAATRMYLDWITGLLQLQAMGQEVPPEFVDGVTERLEKVLGIKLI